MNSLRLKWATLPQKPTANCWQPWSQFPNLDTSAYNPQRPGHLPSLQLYEVIGNTVFATIQWNVIIKLKRSPDLTTKKSTWNRTRYCSLRAMFVRLLGPLWAMMTSDPFSPYYAYIFTKKRHSVGRPVSSIRQLFSLQFIPSLCEVDHWIYPSVTVAHFLKMQSPPQWCSISFYKLIEHYDSMVRVPGWRSVARNDAEGGHREEISGSAASACNASFAAIDCPLSFISFPDDCNMSPFQLFLMSLSVICFTTIDSF